MSAARRSLLTATAAGTLLGALWFVPSANATDGEPLTPPRSAADASIRSEGSPLTPLSPVTYRAPSTKAAQDGARLADTGAFDTAPYVYGGTAFLCVGAGFVVYSVRRSRTAP
ncbi:hypothetical protein ACFV0R_06520 [Streptomyces sp. NPDC059578]|uniref:hypothetical protein n=1 Tax=unclassified Streptomyces TaxID=2593676 RepID=UPI003658B94D